MQEVLTSLDEVTPAVLTDVLRQAGVLREGHIAAIEIRPNAAFNSVVAHLSATYSNNAAFAPETFLIKLNGQSTGEAETAFYTFAQTAQVDTSMLTPCFSARHEPETGNSHLFLLDVSQTHRAPVERNALLSLNGVPGKAHREATVTALAKFHAAWWEHPSLGKPGPTALTGAYNDRAAFEALWAKQQFEFELLVRQHGDQLPASLVELYEHVLSEHARLWDHLEPRVTTLSNLTVTHNDAYLTQFLCPKTEPLPTYLVDFQDVCTDFAARDLVYLLATFWTPEQRQLHERDLLRRYHRTLVHQGVTRYSFDNLLHDYRLMLNFMVFHPVWDASYGANAAYWRPKMACLTAAYVDWRCADLLA